MHGLRREEGGHRSRHVPSPGEEKIIPWKTILSQMSSHLFSLLLSSFPSLPHSSSTFPPLSGTLQQEKNLPLGSRDRSRVSPVGITSTNAGRDFVYTLNHEVNMKLKQHTTHSRLELRVSYQPVQDLFTVHGFHWFVRIFISS